MLPFDPLPLAVATAACLALALLALRLRRRRQGAAPPKRAPTTAEQPGGQAPTRHRPSAVRVLSRSERQAFGLVREALPGRFVMAQVPLARYLRAEDERAGEAWLRGLSSLSADLLVCDASSRPVLAIDILPSAPAGRVRERHDRMRQLLEGAGIRVLVWHEDALPSLPQVRAQLADIPDAPEPQHGRHREAARPQPRKTGSPPGLPARTPSAERVIPPLHPEPGTASRRTREQPRSLAPRIPTPEITELLAEGDEIAARHPTLDPVSLAFLDEFEQRGGAAREARPR